MKAKDPKALWTQLARNITSHSVAYDYFIDVVHRQIPGSVHKAGVLAVLNQLHDRRLYEQTIVTIGNLYLVSGSSQFHFEH